MVDGHAPALDSLVSILNAFEEGVLVEDARGLPLFWNESFSKFFGLRQADLDDFREIRARAGQRVAEGGAEFSFTTLRGERKIGILRSQKMVFGPDNCMTCFFLRDVTDLKFLESMLQRDDEVEPLETLTASAVVGDGVKLIDGLLRSRGVEARIEGAGEAALLGRRSQLNQVVSHLLRNSVEAAGKSDRPWVHVSWNSSGERIEITVRDSGPSGRAPEAALPTTRAPELRARVCRQLVERMGGVLLLDEEDGRVRSKLSLPRVRSILRV